MSCHPPMSTLFPYTTLFRSNVRGSGPCRGRGRGPRFGDRSLFRGARLSARASRDGHRAGRRGGARSEEHTSELQSLTNLVCRLLLEKKKKIILEYNVVSCTQ